jgi:hypothetical protein
MRQLATVLCCGLGFVLVACGTAQTVTTTVVSEKTVISGPPADSQTTKVKPATAAPGKTTSAKAITSPSGKIGCHALAPIEAGEGIECYADYLRTPETYLDPYLGLEPNGRAVLDERGGYSGYDPPPKIVELNYGDTWVRPGIRCSMKKSGLRCENQSKHGFSMSQSNTYRF